MLRILISFLIIGSSLNSGLIAQSLLSLEECMQLARSQSPAARIAALGLKAQGRDYDAFMAGYKPQLSLSANIPGFDRSINSVTQPDGSLEFVSRNLAASSLSLNVSHSFHQTGAQIFASSSIFNRFNLNNAEDVTWQSNMIVVGFQQPIFRVNRMKWSRQEQGISYSLAQIDFNHAVETAARNSMEIFFEALLAQMNYNIAQVNVANNDTIFQISQGRFGVGTIAENELLQSEMNLLNARTSLETADLAYREAIQRLLVSLGLPRDEQISLVSPNEIEVITSDPEYAVRQAIENSSLVRSTELQHLRATQEVALAKEENRINATLSASFGLNQTANTLSEAYKNPLDREAVTVGLEVPIVQWGRAKARIDAAQSREEATRISMDQQRANFENDVRFQVLNLKQLENQLKRTARGDTIAQRRFAVTKSRYLVGKVDIQALFNAQNERDGARELYVRILQNYWMALGRLRQTTLYDFVEMEPIKWELNR